jgi:hypothetical protein
VAALGARLRVRIFGISPEEATFARRGFRGGDAVVRQRLEQVGYTFVRGYNAALEESKPQELEQRLNAVEREHRGFAFEGAAMGLALQDYLMPWSRRRFQAFVAGPASAHVYMAHVGVGWVLARLRLRLAKPPPRLDPLLGWLALDGYGFHEGYFHWPRYVQNRAAPDRLYGYARRAFDQGLGRSLWFVEGADVARISATVASFPESRRADLWSGVGLACAYAGGADKAAIEMLRQAAGPYLPQAAQGAAFAAGARVRAGNPADHTDAACRALCGLSADDAARITDVTLESLPPDGDLPAYEVWRQRIQTHFESIPIGMDAAPS